jgi:transposase
MICAQTRVPGVSVSQVARRYSVNANQVFNWLKDPRFGAGHETDGASCFLPVEIVDPVRHEAGFPVSGDGKIEIELSGGHRLSISGTYDPEALALLIRGLSR